MYTYVKDLILIFDTLQTLPSKWSYREPIEERSAPAADSPCDVWWAVSRNYTVLLQFCDVKNTKFNQHLPVVSRSLNVLVSKFRKLVMFWMWRHRDMALWRHGDGALHNDLFLMTASNVKCWVVVANHVTRLWQAGDTKFWTPDRRRRHTGSGNYSAGLPAGVSTPRGRPA